MEKMTDKVGYGQFNICLHDHGCGLFTNGC